MDQRIQNQLKGLSLLIAGAIGIFNPRITMGFLAAYGFWLLHKSTNSEEEE